MPKQPNATAGPSSYKGRPIKIIEKTADLLKPNAKGKGKEKQVLGDLTRFVGGSYQTWTIQMVIDESETKSLPNALQVERFAKVSFA